MIIEFNIKPNLYQNLIGDLYSIKMQKKIIYNFIPIKFNENYFILTSSLNLDGYLMDYRENILVKLFLQNDVKHIILNSVISVHEDKFNDYDKYDCYIDNLTNLLLIKCHLDDLNYINIDLLNDLSDNENYNNVLDITYKYTKNILDETIYNKKTKLEFIWNNNSLNLPSIPLLCDNTNINDNLVPISGSCVFNNENMIGMVSHIFDYQIIICPLLSIKRFLKSIQYPNEKVLYLGLDLFPVEFNFSNEFNKINYNYGLIIGSNFYDNNKNINNIKGFNLSNNDLDNISHINIKNKNSNIKLLSRKNIICEIDNYKLDSNGYLIINENFSIPFKSYIWLFKNFKNNLVNINLISSNVIDLNIMELKYNKIIINDNYVKKKINIINSQIVINTNYNNISGINLCELKYIKYKNKYIFELNEKILKILKPLAINNKVYEKIFSKIISQKYNTKNKIILGLKINEDNLPILKYINEYDNFDNILEKYDNNHKIKRFIENNV